ncbi:MAG: hypothetical protein GY947_24270 [Rhodobacteraceae bacterium]|nr:hypothetical protein [Paracoccaceae bacterium]
MNAVAPAKTIAPIAVQRFLQRFGLPRRIRDRFVIRAKRVFAPVEEFRRVQWLAYTPLPTSVDIQMLRKTGVALVNTCTLPEAVIAVKEVRAYLNDLRKRGKIVKPEGHYKGDFLVNLANNSDLISRPAIANFVLSHELLSLASHYLGQVPVLSRLDLFWSPVNENKRESQLYHYDGEDETQLRFILYLNDVDEGNGPFTLVSAEDSAKVIPTKVFSRRRSARMDDETVENITGSGSVVRITGPAGTLACCDTGRCLHYGSRARNRERFAIMIQFTRFMCPKNEMPNWQLGTSSWKLTALQKMVLNVA